MFFANTRGAALALSFLGRGKKSASHQNKRGRILASMIQEQLRQEDCSRAKRKREESDELGLQPTIVLGHARIKSIKIASLPPVLKQRFIHPGGE